MNLITKIMLWASPLLPTSMAAQSAQDSALVKNYIHHMNDFGKNHDFGSQIETIDLFFDQQSPVRTFEAENQEINSYLLSLRNAGVQFHYSDTFEIMRCPTTEHESHNLAAIKRIDALGKEHPEMLGIIDGKIVTLIEGTQQHNALDMSLCAPTATSKNNSPTAGKTKN